MEHTLGVGGCQTRAQLPADIADFTGRDEQVKRLSDLLSGTGASGDPGVVRIAVVAGSGGLGKTSLAVHAAHRVRRRFPDGQLYVDLLGATAAPLLPGDVLARFLRDLGVDGRDIPVDEDERAARYRTTLARRRMLVVLDNARDAAQVRPLLPGSASSAVLVTTPNAEYNPQFATLPAGAMRHRDHRFEWTRAQFRSWAESARARASSAGSASISSGCTARAGKAANARHKARTNRRSIFIPPAAIAARHVVPAWARRRAAAGRKGTEPRPPP